MYKYLGKWTNNALCFVIACYFKTKQAPKPAYSSAQRAFARTWQRNFRVGNSNSCTIWLLPNQRGREKGTHRSPEWRRSRWAAQASCRTPCKWEVSLSEELTKKTGQRWASFYAGTTPWRIKGLKAAFAFSFPMKRALLSLIWKDLYSDNLG